MNLHDLPTTIEDPVESLMGFHRRIERQLAVLCRLPVQLEVHGVDAATSAAAASLVTFFASALPRHQQTEAACLWPLIEQRLTTPEKHEFRELRQRLDADERDMERSWRALRRLLEAIGEGVHRTLPGDLVRYFRAVHSVHIGTEEAGVHMLAVRTLRPRDYSVLARSMAARRAVTRSSRD
jgi:hemerythrin HHE cation binding domain-containing protein